MKLLQASSVDVSISVRPPWELRPRDWVSSNPALAIPPLVLHHTLYADFQGRREASHALFPCDVSISGQLVDHTGSLYP